MSIIRLRKRETHAFFNRTALYDERLSWQARGIAAYVLSHGDGWEVRTSQLIKHGKLGREGIRSALKELEQLGYLQRERKQHPDTKQWMWESTFYEEPRAIPANPPTANPPTANPSLNSSKDITNAKDNQRKAEVEDDTNAKDLRAAVFAVLEQQWLTVNPGQLDNHAALAQRYGYENWVRGFNETPAKHRSKFSYVEKLCVPDDTQDKTDEVFSSIKIAR